MNCSAHNRFLPPAQDVITSAIPQDSSVKVDFLQSGKNISPNFCISKTPVCQRHTLLDIITYSNDSGLRIISPLQSINKTSSSSNNVLQRSTETNSSDIEANLNMKIRTVKQFADSLPAHIIVLSTEVWRGVGYRSLT